MGSTKRRRWRSNKLLAAGIAVAVLAGIGGGSAFAYVTLKQNADQLQAALTKDLQAGQRELEAGKASLTQANSKHDTSLVTEAISHFVSAKDQFLAASQRADRSQLLRYLEYAPGVSGFAHSRHAAVDSIAGMGAALSDAGQELANLDGQLLKPAGSGDAGHTLLTVLSQTSASLVKVRGDLDRAQKAAIQVDIQVVPTGQQASFLKARATIVAALTGLDEFQRLVPVMTDVLGGNGVRNFLIEQVNPAELRSGGGFIGTYSLLKADQGVLTVVKSGDAYDLAYPRPSPGQSGFIPQPTPYREIVPNVSWSFVDSNIYPDFPSNAKAALSFVQPRLGIKVDAVISMDYYTVAKVLEITGPIPVPGYGLTVDSSNFIPQIAKYDVVQTDTVHKAILSALAGPLMQRLSSLSADRWPALMSDLNSMASQRHLQAYFDDPSDESELDRIGWSGAVNPVGTTDYMMEVESNYYGDKVNYFLTRRFTLVLTRRGSVLHHQISVDLVNSTRCFSADRTSYRADARLFMTADASSAINNLRAVKYANPAPPPGTAVLDGWLPDILCNGGSGHGGFEYDTPWPANSKGFDTVYWQKQPGTVSDAINVTWHDGNGHTFTTSGDLSQDRLITLSPSGVNLSAGQAAQATLPSLNLG